MRNITPLRDGYDLDSARFHVECACLLSTDYNSLAVFTDAGGEILNDNPLIATCPRCENTAEAEATLIRNNADALGKTNITVGLEICGDGVVDTTLPHGTCPACETNIYPEHYHENGNHPEVGWCHYQCPSCATGILPGRFDVQTPPATEK
jgi:hypothetical protein